MPRFPALAAVALAVAALVVQCSAGNAASQVPLRRFGAQRGRAHPHPPGQRIPHAAAARDPSAPDFVALKQLRGSAPGVHAPHRREAMGFIANERHSFRHSAPTKHGWVDWSHDGGWVREELEGLPVVLGGLPLNF